MCLCVCIYSFVYILLFVVCIDAKICQRTFIKPTCRSKVYWFTMGYTFSSPVAYNQILIFVAPELSWHDREENILTFIVVLYLDYQLSCHSSLGLVEPGLTLLGFRHKKHIKFIETQNYDKIFENLKAYCKQRLSVNLPVLTWWFTLYHQKR